MKLVPDCKTVSVFSWMYPGLPENLQYLYQEQMEYTSPLDARSATVGSMRLLASVRMRSASSELVRPTPERDHLEERLPAVLPLHYRVDGEFFDRPLPGIWRRTGWISYKYTILNVNRFHGR